MRTQIGNPQHLPLPGQLLLMSVSMFLTGGFCGMLWLASQTDLWTAVLGGETYMTTFLSHLVILSSTLSVLLLFAGCSTIAVAVVAHVIPEIIARARSLRRWL